MWVLGLELGSKPDKPQLEQKFMKEEKGHPSSWKKGVPVRKPFLEMWKRNHNLGSLVKIWDYWR